MSENYPLEYREADFFNGRNGAMDRLMKDLATTPLRVKKTVEGKTFFCYACRTASTRSSPAGGWRGLIEDTNGYTYSVEGIWKCEESAVERACEEIEEMPLRDPERWDAF